MQKEYKYKGKYKYKVKYKYKRKHKHKYIFIQQPPSTTAALNKSDERCKRDHEETQRARNMHSTYK